MAETIALPPIPEASAAARSYMLHGNSITLSPDQAKALDLALAGENIFLTGEPGTGKSLVVKILRIELLSKRKSVAFLAPTGLAALNISGSTIHKFFKFPTMPLAKSMGTGLGKGFRLRDMINATDVFVIDELSMCRSDIFTAIDMACRAATNRPELPFGGKQIIGVGDFFQLPPVVEKPELHHWLSQQFGGVMCCHTPSWAEAQFKVCALTTAHRQAGDSEFNAALTLIRHKDPRGIQAINQMAMVTHDYSGTIITFTNDSARVVNERQLAKLERQAFTYHAERDKFAVAPVDAEITLKVGARVMMMANTDEFVNGDLGEIIQLNQNSAIVKLDRGGVKVTVEPYTWETKNYTVGTDGKLAEETAGGYKQLPIRLGWAITAHKSQGQTLDEVTLLMDSRPFESGQLYVALSRVRSAKNLKLGRPLDTYDLV